MNVEYKRVATDEEIQTLAQTAEEIWYEYFNSLLESDLLEYIVEKFQSYEALREVIRNKRYEYYFIMTQNEIAGYMALCEENDKLFISKLYLKKEQRGKGVGGKSIDYTVEMAESRNLQSIWLTVYKDNLSSIKVYERKGFVFKEPVNRDIGNGHIVEDIIYEKVLNKKVL